jgi:hypothetical protein
LKEQIKYQTIFFPDELILGHNPGTTFMCFYEPFVSSWHPMRPCIVF